MRMNFGINLAMRMGMRRSAPSVCFEAFEEVDPDDERLSFEDALVRMGLMELLDDDVLITRYRSAIAARFRKIGLAHRFPPSVQSKLDRNTHIKSLFVSDAKFYEEVTLAWCGHVDRELAKKRRAAERAAEADGFKLFTTQAKEGNDAPAVEFDEATNLPKVPLLKRAEDPNERGLLYALAMDWLGGPEINPYKRAPDPPFAVRGCNPFMAFEGSAEARYHGCGLMRFDGCLEHGEERITVPRARELMTEAGCAPGTFRDLARHLTPAVIGTVVTGRPIVALLPECEAGIACFSLSPAFDVTLDIACANGPGFPKGTRFMALHDVE